MTAGFQSLALPFFCLTCRSSYDRPDLLVECLRLHAETAQRMDEAAAMMRVVP